ncbi:MAG: SDR family oxidoreductase [Candidatus Eisenbacteria bacterium]
MRPANPEREAVLVTGGAGFIGSHLADRLAGTGRFVRILDDLSTGRRENVERLLGRHPGRIEFLQGDVRSPADVQRAVEGVRAILHQAALPSVERSVKDPWTSHEVNVDGTVRLLEAARGSGVQRFLLAGSSSVYGDQPELPKRETMSPSPRSPYALSKLEAEQHVRLYAELYGLSGVTLRYFNVFGPRQDPGSPYAAVIPLFLRAMLSGEPPTIFGDGLQTRDFTYIDNVVDANLAALEAPELHGEAVNVACGDRISLLDLLGVLGDVTGRKVEPRFAPSRTGDVRDSMADISRARSLLGFQPRIGLREGIAETLAWFREAS